MGLTFEHMLYSLGITLQLIWNFIGIIIEVLFLWTLIIEQNAPIWKSNVSGYTTWGWPSNMC